MKLLKTRYVTLCVMIGMLVLSGEAQAVPVGINIEPANFDNLLGGLASPTNPPLVSSFTIGNLSAIVTSQPFSDGAGNYLYLYQVNNTGGPGGESITRFTVSPYVGANSSIALGYLISSIPDEFSVGDQTPLYGDVDSDSGPTVGFNFPVGIPYFGIPDSYISAGNSSSVMYVESTVGPGIVTGNVIDGIVASVSIFGPVPEPSTAALLGLGMAGCALARRRLLTNSWGCRSRNSPQVGDPAACRIRTGTCRCHC